MQLINLVGLRFGRLLVTSIARQGRQSPTWECSCDCGGRTVVRGSHLRAGSIRSCGCLQREVTRHINYKHGESGTRLFKIWAGMLQRCTNPNTSKWGRYGGRGISVCAEWVSSFVAFRDWALTNGYSDGLTLDRSDNDGNYEPGNCRWATQAEQARNTSANRAVIRSDGASYGSVSEAADAMGCWPSEIVNTCVGRQKTCHGFAWKYQSEA